MIIFLTGGTGFVGKRFLKLATDRGHFVYSVSRKKNYKIKNNIKWLKGEVDDDWKKFIKKSDVIVHLAAKGVRSYRNKDYYEVINFNVKKSFGPIKIRQFISDGSTIIYKSVSDASKETGATRVSDVCSGKKRHTKGMVFRYYIP